MKILLHFNENVESDDICKAATGKDNLHETSNKNGVAVEHYLTLEDLSLKNAILPQYKID
jgi:hypothetical protein